ncbi:ABC transporter ATP-binding protein [Evansella clarkii]|jgi:peptide/nickel transport system ATP-binding protein/oligopeptide transport system ATP-binding protein|uniref:ABC transporter ATP-binding protein n=1 Tax=Evansella clarkii TaxID=79879 RepID=UPI000B4427B6|nr:dipeptide ABC transporter ATP-binding protein [Evansella clarkii]
MTQRKSLIKLQDLKKYYPVRSKFIKRTESHVKAVNGVTLDVYQGETLGVVGESGCGKSTLGRTIMQLEKSTNGRILFDNEDLTKLNRRKLKPFRKQMQMIFQDPFASLNPRQRIGDAIEEALVIHTSLTKEERRARVRSILEEVGLKPEHAERYPHEFSGGQRQRIGIGRAIAVNPKFLVCDEPVSALDVSVQAQIIKLLKDIQEKENLTYLFISHDLGVVRHICNRVMVMYLGHMVELATVEKLYKSPTHPYTEALLSAIPRPDTSKKTQRIKIKGELPSPSDNISGCPFHTRCPLVTERCKVEVPEWREVDAGHYVACHER